MPGRGGSSGGAEMPRPSAIRSGFALDEAAIEAPPGDTDVQERAANSLWNKRSASRRPSSLNTTDFALPTGLEMTPFA